MQRIALPDFLIIAEQHCGVPAEHLARQPRTVTLAQSALAAPFAGYGDVEVFPSFEAKAAIHCSRISGYQPLPDGNKRTGYDVMREFVERNGYTFTHPAGGDLETAEVIYRLSEKKITEDEFVAWIAERITGT